MKKRKIFLLIVLLVLIGFSLFFLSGLLSKPLADYEILDHDDRSETIRITISDKSILKRQFGVALDEMAVSDASTDFETYDPEKTYVIEAGTYHIHVKDAIGRTFDTEYPFYPVGEKIDLNCDLLTFGNDETLRFTSSDENVAFVRDHKIVTNSPGTATITVSSQGASDSIDVEVTNLYTLIDTDSMDKPILHETICNNEENRKLDKVLEMKITEAGYVPVAVTDSLEARDPRFALQIPYKVIQGGFTPNPRNDN